MILREDDDEGKPVTYWIAHGTQLLRCAPHHVRADFQQADTTVIGGLEGQTLSDGAQVERHHSLH